MTVQHVPAGDSHDAYLVWIPLAYGAERLGVLGSTAGDASAAVLARYRTLAAMMIMAKSGYSDNASPRKRVLRQRPDRVVPPRA